MIDYSDNAISIYKRLYFAEGETKPEHTHERVARFIANNNKEYEQFKFLLDNKIFRPNTPTLISAGVGGNNPWDRNLSACFVLGMEDSMESIIDVWSTCSKIYAGGAGSGIPITNLREEGAPIGGNKGKASGPLNYLHVIESVANTVKSGGRHRRASNLASARYNHPDIFKIIDAKLDENNLKSFNISILVDDWFMKQVERGEDFNVDLISPNGNKKVNSVNGMDIWHRIVNRAWKSGDPGLLFYDTANNFHPFLNEKIESSNPCVIGNTLILLRKGYIDNVNNYYPIRDFVGKEIEIWNGFGWRKVTPQKTGENQHLYKIKLRNVFNGDHEILYCTDYHRFLLENGIKIPTIKLKLFDKTPIWRTPDKEFVQHEVVEILSTANYDDVYCFTEPQDHTGVFNGVLTGQCGEVLLPPWSVCNLGSINLMKCITNHEFDWDKFKEYVRLSFRFLDNVIDKTDFVHEKFKERAYKERPVGLGIMGFSDLLFELKIPYNSNEAIDFFMDICHYLNKFSIVESINLAREKNEPIYTSHSRLEDLIAYYVQDEEILKEYKEYGIRNSTWTSIAPTGSISISADTSYSFEPCFALVWTKELAESHELMHFVNPVFEKWLDENRPVEKGSIIKMVADNKGSLKGLGFPKEISDVFVTAHDIDPIDKIKMQESGQAYISLGISSTCNLPGSATIEDVSKIMLEAWKRKLKGITVYRDGCKSWQPVNFSKKELKSDKYTRPIKRSGETFEIKTPDGALYITVNKDGNKPMEVFLRMGKQGSKINLLIDALSRCISRGLQNNVKLSEFADTLRGNKEDTFYFRLDENQETPYQAESIIDAIGIILNYVASSEGEVKLLDDKGNMYEECPVCNKFTLTRSSGCKGGNCLNSECLYTSCG